VLLMQIRKELQEGAFWSLGHNTQEEVAEHLQWVQSELSRVD
jgi:hypothetical protein